MNWEALYWLAYEDGHNHRGLRSHRLSEYAKAYADISGDGLRASLSWHWYAWQHGQCVPSQGGTYHYQPRLVAVV